jgi:RNA polymerase sigma-70 factor, ECF subfamily
MTAYHNNDFSEQTQRLVLQAQTGDAVALNDLLTQIQPYVLILAKRKLSDAHEADELAQDVLLKIALKIGQLREAGAFAGWVRQIVCRLAVNRVARRQNLIVCDPDTMDTTCDRFGDPVTHMERDESVTMVRDGLRRLGTVDRQTLEAFYLRGQSLAEMSDSFAAPLGTIKRRLHTARKRLAQEVDSLQAV